MKYYILKLFLCLQIFMFSQNIQPMISMPSSNALSLGSYGQNPVSLHNGTVGITVPIYELIEGDIKVPIELVHKSDGAKPDVHPGWVGQNWALKAGGMITRIIKGFPDEGFMKNDFLVLDNHYTQKSQSFYFGKFYNQNAYNTNWTQSSYIESKANGKEFGYLQESEPDEFIFNFNGYSGSFYFDKDDIKVIGNKGIKVELVSLYDVEASNFNFSYKNFLYTYSVNPLIDDKGGFVRYTDKKIGGFKIRTPDGLIYEFGNKNLTLSENDAIDSSKNFFGQVDLTESWDTWYLKKIISPKGDIVNFNYSLRDSSKKLNPTVQFNRTYSMEKTSASAPAYGIFGIKMGTISGDSYDKQEYFSGKIIWQTYLSSIETSTKKIDFSISKSNEKTYNYESIMYDLYEQLKQTYTTKITHFLSPREYSILTSRYDPNRLACLYVGLGGNSTYEECLNFNNVQWKKLDNIIIKDLQTNNIIKKTSFEYTNDFSKRLMLLSIKNENPINQENISKYNFEYDESVNLPEYNSYQTDHWGYYNGKKPNLGNFTDTDLQNFTNYKEPDFNFAKVGSLKKVIYPTGGYSEFTYELNNVEKVVTRDQNTGNFSLINQNRNIGGLRISQIKTVAQNGIESIKKYKYYGGISSGIPQYFWKGLQGKMTSGAIYTSDRFLSETVMPMISNVLDYHIGYSKVEEIEDGNGKTEHYFSNYDILDDNFLATIDSKKSIFSPFSSKKRERGLLLERKIYKEISPNNYQLIEYFKNNYNQNPNRYNDFIPAINIGQIGILGGATIYGSAYKIYNNPILVDKNSLFEYKLDKVMGTLTNYSYDPLSLRYKTVQTTNSLNQVLKTEYLYPQDLIGKKPLMQELVNANRIAEPVITTSFNNSTQISKSEVEYSNSLNTNKLILPAFAYAKKGSGEIDKTQDKQITYNSYDNFGNLTQYTQENGIPVAVVWGYNNQHPIAKLEGMTYAQIPVATITDLQNKSNADKDSATETILINALNNLRTSFPDAMITTYSYDPLIGVTSITSPANTTEFYVYDEALRLKQILDKDKNIVKEFKYNYKMFANEKQSKVFVKNNCGGTLSQGDSYTYVVEEGKYGATTQKQADELALKEINEKGQAEANAKVGCTFYNKYYKNTYTKQYCQNPIKYDLIIPEKKYSSRVNQKEVDDKVNEEILTYSNKIKQEGECNSSMTIFKSEGRLVTQSNFYECSTGQLLKLKIHTENKDILNSLNNKIPFKVGNLIGRYIPYKTKTFNIYNNNASEIWKVTIEAITGVVMVENIKGFYIGSSTQELKIPYQIYEYTPDENIYTGGIYETYPTGDSAYFEVYEDIVFDCHPSKMVYRIGQYGSYQTFYSSYAGEVFTIFRGAYLHGELQTYNNDFIIESFELLDN